MAVCSFTTGAKKENLERKETKKKKKEKEKKRKRKRTKGLQIKRKLVIDPTAWLSGHNGGHLSNQCDARRKKRCHTCTNGKSRPGKIRREENLWTWCPGGNWETGILGISGARSVTSLHCQLQMSTLGMIDKGRENSPIRV